MSQRLMSDAIGVTMSSGECRDVERMARERKFNEMKN